MREIKFRVFSYEGNEMIEWDQLKEASDLAEFIKHPEECAYYSELMQYTGVKDKNGTEIYEGDILLVTSEIYTNFGKTPTGKFSKEYLEVIWKDDGWGHKVLKSNHTIEGTEIKGLKVITKYAEVIGNIYEHPHLLEGAE